MVGMVGIDGPGAVELLDQQHFHFPARRTPEPQPRRNDPRVVDDHQLSGELSREICERAMPDLTARASVDEEP